MADYVANQVIAETQQTVSSTALGLADFSGITAQNVADATRMWLTVHSGSIRLYYGGTAPTTSAGHKVTSGSDLLITGRDALANLQVIRDGSTDVEVAVTLER